MSGTVVLMHSLRRAHHVVPKEAIMKHTMLLMGFDDFITEYKKLSKHKMSETMRIFQKLTCDRLL